jgi:hypothetical protein
VASLRGDLLDCGRERRGARRERLDALVGEEEGDGLFVMYEQPFWGWTVVGPSFHRTETKPSFVETSFNLNGSVRKSKKDGFRRSQALGCRGGLQLRRRPADDSERRVAIMNAILRVV